MSEVRGGIGVWTWPAFAGLGFDAVVTTREGGVSEGPYATLNLGLHVGDVPERVMENRRRAAAAVGLALDALVFCDQPHGSVVADVDGPGGPVAGADAMVTSNPDVGLAVMVADCVPVVLFDPVTRTLACAHAGWRGTVAGVVRVALERMVARGVRAEDVVAGLGPAVEVARYEVGEEVVDAARAAGLGGSVVDGRFDLWGANRAVLVAAGVREANVSVAAVGTGADTFFYSDRRERPCGRFAVIARLAVRRSGDPDRDFGHATQVRD